MLNRQNLNLENLLILILIQYHFNLDSLQLLFILEKILKTKLKKVIFLLMILLRKKHWYNLYLKDPMKKKQLQHLVPLVNLPQQALDYLVQEHLEFLPLLLNLHLALLTLKVYLELLKIQKLFTKLYKERII